MPYAIQLPSVTGRYGILKPRAYVSTTIRNMHCKLITTCEGIIYQSTLLQVKKEPWKTNNSPSAPPALHSGMRRQLLLPVAVAAAAVSAASALIVPGSVRRSAPTGRLPFVRQWGGRGNGQGQFERPRAVVVGEDLVVVCDTYNHRVQVFGWDGAFVRQWGGRGNGPGRFNHPSGVAVKGVGWSEVRGKFWWDRLRRIVLLW